VKAGAIAAGLAAAFALSPLADAQAPAKVVRIGYLTPTKVVAREAAFREAMASLGYVEGKNLKLEYRNADGRFDRLPALAEELVRLDVDVIVASLTQATLAAKSATNRIPIVMGAVGDPVGAGIVPNFAKPGGNVTGVSLSAIDVMGKLLELLREVRPSLARVAVLFNPANPVFQAQQLDAARAAAAKLGVELVLVEARQPEALERAFRAIAAARTDGLLVLGDPILAAHVQRIARFAIEQKLPTVSGFATYTEAGGLVSYGADFQDAFRRVAFYVDRIVRGARPADLPVEQATRFELVLNMKTAHAVGIAMPSTLVSRADRVIR
jgi:putative ABC transport system substrate-binding protein